ncbi:MAG: dCTP deaminase [Dehalococcoidia bacterium]|nr:dCTP deaminase [Dehalococcoidia bacterium]
MTHDSIGERHYKDTVEGIRRLEQYLSEQKPPPTYPDRAILIETGIRICQMMRASLRNERQSSSTSPDFDIFQLCATYHKHLKSLEEQILDFIPLMDPFAQPFEIVEPIKASIQKFEQSFVLILLSYFQDNYELYACEGLYESYVNILSTYVPDKYRVFKTPKWFVFLSFPRIHSRDVLRHVITVSHEMLHLRGLVLGITSDLLSEIQISPDDIQPLVEQIRTTPFPAEQPSSPPLTMGEIYSPHEIERRTKELCSEILEHWLSEIVADLLATRIFGPAFFFSLAHLSLSLGTMDQHSLSHPSSRLRLRMMLDVLHNLGYMKKGKTDQVAYSELKKWDRYLKEDVSVISIPPFSIAQSKVEETKKTIMAKAEQITDGETYNTDAFQNEVPKLVELLCNGVSPAEIKENRSIKPACLASILNAGYIVFLAHLSRLNTMLGDYRDNHLVVSKLNDLLLHAIQASTISQQWLQFRDKQHVAVAKIEESVDAEITERAGAPSAVELLNRIFASDLNDQLVITPQLELNPRDGTLDLHLGTKFLLFRLTRHGIINPSTISEEEAHEFLERLQLRLGEKLILHPGQLLLASTLEYLSLPPDLGASVVTRSSYGRLGLVTATSIFVHPGFKGCLTLELTNVGNSPIALRPGERIAQLVFEYHVPDKKPFATKYLLATQPEFPKMWEDPDREFLRKLGGSH